MSLLTTSRSVRTTDTSTTRLQRTVIFLMLRGYLDTEKAWCDISASLRCQAGSEVSDLEDTGGVLILSLTCPAFSAMNSGCVTTKSPIAGIPLRSCVSGLVCG